MGALVAGLVVVGFFWQRSARETRRAEAANLLSLGQLELDNYLTATVAYATASLELADSEAARRLALEALWKGPTALVASEGNAWRTRFSPDGRSLVLGTNHFGNSEESALTVFSADGSSSPLVNVHPKSAAIALSSISTSGHFASHSFAKAADSSRKIVLWSVDSDHPIADTVLNVSQVLWQTVIDSGRKRLVLLNRDDDLIRVDTLGFDGKREHLGTLEFRTRRDESGEWTTVARLDPQAGAWLGVVTGEQVFVVGVGDHDLSPPLLIGRHEGVLSNCAGDPLGRFIVTAGRNGDFRFWSLTDSKPPTIEQGPPDTQYFGFTTDGSMFSAVVEEDESWIVWVWDTRGDRPQFLRKLDIGGTSFGFYTLDDSGRYIARRGPDTSFRLWPLHGPADADPIVLHRGDNQQTNDFAFNPKGGWLATADLAGHVVWPVARDYPFVIRQHDGVVDGLAFAPDGSWFASSSLDGTVRIWPLAGASPPPGSIRYEADGMLHGLAVSPDGQNLVVGAADGKTALLTPDGTPPTILGGFSGQTWGVDFSPDGRLVAAAGGLFNPADRAIHIWDVASGEEMKVVEIDEQPFVEKIQFLPNNQVLSTTQSALVRWDTETGKSTRLYEGVIPNFAASADGRRVLLVGPSSPSVPFGEVVLLNTETGRSTPLERFGDQVTTIACDPTASVIATGDKDGEVRVGLVDGGEPHLFTGHEGHVNVVVFDPLGRWIASGGTDFTVRLWPMPDLSKPPLHTLPREELIAKLKTLTNLRVVRDPESATGWKLTHDPFPGWETVPTW